MRNDLLNMVRGMAMGCADVVPGVSGGTVALIIGIYERLVTAISSVDGQFFQLLKQRQWRKAAIHLDLRFLIALACGVLMGFVVMTLAMNAILKSESGRPLLLSAFFGMIVVSSWLVAKMVKPHNHAERVQCIVFAIVGAGLTLSLLWLRSPTAGAAAEPSLPFLFGCGAIAICAMILPGISGAMVLLMCGVYAYLADIPHLLLHGEQIGLCLLTIAVFGSGCLIGLLTFAKVLRWLLGKHRALTLALLTGVMAGALPQIWPFQHDLTPHIEEVKFKQFELIWPTAWSPLVTQCLLVAVAAAVVLWLVDVCRRTFGVQPVDSANSPA